MSDIDEEFRLLQKLKASQSKAKAALGSAAAGYDEHIYDSATNGTDDKYAGYDTELSVEESAAATNGGGGGRTNGSSKWSLPDQMMRELPRGDAHDPEDAEDPFGQGKRALSKREDEYHARRRLRPLSPERKDAFDLKKKKRADEPSTTSSSARSYAEVMLETQLDRQHDELVHKISKHQQEQQEKAMDQEVDGVDGQKITSKSSEWDRPDETPRVASGRWDETPRVEHGDGDSGKPLRKRNRWDETPVGAGTGAAQSSGSSRWDQTPLVQSGGSAVGDTPRRARSRWDETPVHVANAGGAGSTPAMKARSSLENVPLHMQSRIDREIAARNQPLTDAELELMLPSAGYQILPPPANYRPIRTPSRKLMATPAPQAQHDDSFYLQEEDRRQQFDVPPDFSNAAGETLPLFKPEDVQFFGKLLDGKGEDDMTYDEAKERKIMRLLLRIKNGTPPMRKVALKQITDNARLFGPAALFNQILPLLMSPTLEDQERHLMVKVIDRCLYKLDDLVRPFVHKILVVIEPMLIDEDYYARVEGREIISNLSKAAGLATMIATMRPDIDHVDEYVRNTTARAFSVVASALGVPALLPFLKAVCKSKKSWQARHTGIKIVQQISILLGCGVLPHLRSLVEAIAHGLDDEQQKVRTMAALSISALAEAAAPYGIESFDGVLQPLWHGIRKHRGKGLAAFLKAVGFIVPLMDPEYANYYTKHMMPILIREFQSPDDEMKKIVLKVIKQCATTDGVEPQYIREEIMPEFFKHFWVRRMALDKRNYKQLVETTVELSNRVGVAEIANRLVHNIKDESEPFRKMVIEALHEIVALHGAADIDERLEELIIDGLLFSFQEQNSTDDMTILDGFGVVVTALGLRTKRYLPQICSTILWRLNNKTATVRQQAADLIARVAMTMNICGEEKLLGHLGVVLYEYLGEEYPDVLGSILSGLKAIVNVIGMTKMNPPIKDLLPRLTPILKNRHEKVQENCIDLIGRIADRGAEFVSPREWMRICFELLETLKAHRKAIRRAAVNTFGYIAKAIGPQDVLVTLLNNLKVQERQLRVCTTVAIAIVAETCSPFTVLPALMNEYRVPEQNVQNGVLKALSFMFEYIGEMGKDYIYAVTSLFEDALMDRDAVHRQTASTAVMHLAIGCVGLGVEDALTHLLNLVWPNIFEVSPHVINAVMGAVDGFRVSLGPAVIFMYILQGLFHPARKVREAYWKVYNNLYIGAQDQMVAFYPRIPSTERNAYERCELDLVL